MREKKTGLKVLSVFLITMLLFSMVPFAALASENELQESKYEVFSGTGENNNEELFAGYVQNMFYGENIAMYGVSAGNQLGEIQRAIYDQLKTEITAIANGERESAVIQVDDKYAQYVTNETVFEVLTPVHDALLHDCPYELYWYDKEIGFAMMYNCDTMSGSVYDLSLCFSVAEDYQAEDYTDYAPAVDTEKTGATVEAVLNANSIVEAYEDLDDYKKLLVYCMEICDLASYNHDAAYGNYSEGYGDPWQLIYVFDGDNTTNVVCEGYAKAFQYLCDISTFENDISCYTVEGYMEGATGAGGHMWNIVSINGQQFLVDVTNCDTNTVGENAKLFLIGAEGDIDNGYVCNVNNREVAYSYSSQVIELWGSGSDSILCLNENNYTPAQDGTDSSEQNGYQLTFVYDKNLCDFVAYDWYTDEYVENGEYLPIDEEDNRAYAVFEITDIVDGYRIKDFRINNRSYAKVMIDGAYGGCATTITGDSTLEVILEEVPASLPAIQAITIYTDQLAQADSEVAEEVVFDSDMYGLHAIITYANNQEYPDYYASCSWEYSVDGGKSWTEVPGWGSHTNFNANWSLFPSYGLDFMTMENYLIRVRVTPKEYYSTIGDAEYLYSNPVVVNKTDSDVTESTRLAAPTNLKWNVNEAGQTEYGYISWNTVENCEGEYYYEIYKDGELYDLPCGREARSFYTDEYGDTVTINIKPELNESGTYSFSVKAVGDDVSYTDSEMVTSGEYVYVRPDNELAAPTDLKWEGTTRYWKPVEGAWAYEIYYYKNGWLAGSTWERPQELTTDGEWVYTNETWLFDLIEMQDDGRGKWSFKVLAFSDDITKIANSRISAMSPTTDIGELSYQVGDQLEEWNTAVGEGVMSAAEARSRLLEENKGNLAAALAASDDVVMGLNDLDGLYRYEQGVTVRVNVTNEAMNSGVLDAIVITGAALNTDVANSEVTFNISKSKTDYPINNAQQYKNTVFMDMNLSGDGINPDGSLEVPVHIKMPVPANITVHDRFRILHFLNSSGDYELIVPAITYESGKPYASFVLTHFSPFAFTEARVLGETPSVPEPEPKPEPKPEKIETTPMYRLYNPNSGEHFYTGSIEERDMLVSVGWNYEGVAWNAPTKTGAPVYRLFNPNSGDHHYTMSEEERDNLTAVGWQYEGVCWNSASADNLPQYRLYNPNADCGSHHYTGSTEERDMLVSVGWIYEGIGWFGMLN